ncbi:hypothetical protein PAXRUDRAFT_322909 [Paxillus rubicundulus Ve08.2h10]|uniref:Uncharacterized protein n=1 Tax=Paxillus rubicundulus Ve08.2h10 TaxID=930991 RepID=A0A0D0EA04_9AGAM|nr:hypothetical protein PAXRUDRAFT_322909 [Paxillus rubicundulus Ve08.2h10]
MYLLRAYHKKPPQPESWNAVRRPSLTRTSLRRLRQTKASKLATTLSSFTLPLSFILCQSSFTQGMR